MPEYDFDLSEFYLECLNNKKPGTLRVAYDHVLEELKEGNEIPNDLIIAVLEANPPRGKDANSDLADALWMIQGRRLIMNEEGEVIGTRSFMDAARWWQARTKEIPYEERNAFEKKYANKSDEQLKSALDKAKKRMR